MLKYSMANINLNMDLNVLEAPLSVYMKVSTACMLDCVFCSQKCNQIEHMDLDLAKHILSELKKNNVQYIYYTGGEPLLNNKLMDIVSYGKSLGFYQVLVTNALLLNKKSHLKIIDYIDVLGVSLHGSEKVHDTLSNKKGTYNSVLKALQSVKAYKPQLPININCTLTEYNTNYENMLFLANFCKDNQFDLSFARINFINKAKNFNSSVENVENALEIISTLQKKGYKVKVSNCIAPCTVSSEYRPLLHGCAAGFGIAAIETNGDVKICPTSEYVLGNMKDKTFKKVWNCKELKTFKKLKWLPAQCTSCQFVLTCKGGCRAEGNGLFWNEISDQLVIDKFENLWKEIKDNVHEFIPSCIRKDYKNYTIIHFPARLCSKEVVNVIKSLNLGLTPQQIFELHNYSTDVKNLIIAFKIDSFLKEQ